MCQEKVFMEVPQMIIKLNQRGFTLIELVIII
ncbi:MAG: prepilin-type N-terminal cleavage/methylation domain-containing protein, partial [Bacteroidales bacterium]|nr:prepilin-type N-terminal cleavage/methylation domain-containing protein [Bacteroidales bacterium]